MITPLNTTIQEDVNFEGEQKITPLFQPKEPEQKEINIKEYVDLQCNNVVAFVINWIKTSYTKMIMSYLETEYKQQIIKELKQYN